MCQLEKEFFPFGVHTYSDGRGKRQGLKLYPYFLQTFCVRSCHLEMCQLEKEFFPFGVHTYSDGRRKWQELKLYTYFLHASCLRSCHLECVNSKRNYFLLELTHFQMGKGKWQVLKLKPYFNILPVTFLPSGNVSTQKGILSFWSWHIFRWKGKMTRVETVSILFTYFLLRSCHLEMCQLEKEFFPFGVHTFSDGRG